MMLTPAYIGEFGEWYITGRDVEDGNSGKTHLMQFTGLQDKHGRDIFEGDIVWTYETGVGNLFREVAFDDGSFCLKHPYCLTSELRGWKLDYLEVVGNIYQNAAMLQP